MTKLTRKTQTRRIWYLMDVCSSCQPHIVENPALVGGDFVRDSGENTPCCDSIMVSIYRLEYGDEDVDSELPIQPPMKIGELLDELRRIYEDRGKDLNCSLGKIGKLFGVAVVDGEVSFLPYPTNYNPK